MSLTHLLTAAAAFVVAPLTATPAQTPAQETSVTAEPAVVAAGSSLEVTGTCGPDAGADPVPILVGGGIEGGQVAEVAPDPISGDFSTTVTIPADSPTGTGTLSAGCGLGADIDPSTTFTITTATDPGDDSGAESDGAPTLTRGDTGLLVEYWQDRLNEWIVLSDTDISPITVDGIYGPVTENATRTFQDATTTVETDGTVDPVDRVALREAIEALESDGAPTLTRGDTGLLVEYWQDRLNEWIVLSDTDISPITVDGIYGPVTENATRTFQDATTTVETDGTVDPVDRVALREAIEALESDGAPTLTRGDTGLLVEYWQDRLNEWIVLSDTDISPITVDGIYGPVTENATRTFQDATTTVETDGTVDPVDRVALREAIEALESDGAGGGDDEPVTLSQSCESPEGWSVSYPGDWNTNAGDVVAPCSMFDPEPFEVPDASDERVAAITAFVSDVSYFDAATPEPEPTDRAQTEIDGHQAVRITTAAGDDSIYPADTAITRYVVDLSGDAADRGSALLVDTVDLSSVDYDRAVRVLDEMMATMELSVGVDRDESVVARYDGASVAVSIEATASDGEICLSLDTTGNESCVDAPDADGTTATSLGDDLAPFIAGAAGANVFRVDVVSDGTTTSFLPRSIPDTDVRGWGMPGDLADVDEIRTYAIDGEPLADLAFDDAGAPVS